VGKGCGGWSVPTDTGSFEEVENFTGLLRALNPEKTARSID